jgi:hypothetical protein
MKKIIFIAFFLLIYTAILHADCIHNGVLYPTGTIINGLTCQADGSWR